MSGKTTEEILTGIATEIRESDEFKQLLAEIGPDQIRLNILKGLARLNLKRMSR